MPATASPIRVLLVISSRLERLGWSIVVNGQEDMQLLGEFDSCHEAFEFLAAHGADVVLVDEALLTPKDSKALRRHTTCHGTRFLLVTPHPLDEALERAHYSFVSDWLLKGLSASDLLAAIRGKRPSLSDDSVTRPPARAQDSRESASAARKSSHG